jgi:hypothetical protein
LGLYKSRESIQKYQRLIAELLPASSPQVCPPTIIPERVDPTTTVDQMIRAFWEHVTKHYRDSEGKPTTEVKEIKISLSPLRDLFGDTPAAAFGPKNLNSVRQRMMRAGWCRTLINRRMERVKRAFK